MSAMPEDFWKKTVQIRITIAAPRFLDGKSSRRLMYENRR